jgi:hypothetical protein
LHVSHPYYKPVELLVGDAAVACGRVLVDLGMPYDVILSAAWEDGEHTSIDVVGRETTGKAIALFAEGRDLVGLSLTPGAGVSWIAVRGRGLEVLAIRPFGALVAPFDPPRTLVLQRGSPWRVLVVDERYSPVHGARVDARLVCNGAHLLLASAETDLEGHAALGVVPTGQTEDVFLSVSAGDGPEAARAPYERSPNPQVIILHRTGSVELSITGSRAALGVIAGCDVVTMGATATATATIGRDATGRTRWVRSPEEAAYVDAPRRVASLGRALGGILRTDGVPLGRHVWHWWLVPSRMSHSAEVTISPGETASVRWHLRGLEERGVYLHAVDAYSGQPVEDAYFSLNNQAVVSEGSRTRVSLAPGDQVVVGAPAHASIGIKIATAAEDGVRAVRLPRARIVRVQVADSIAAVLPSEVRLTLRVPRDIASESWGREETVYATVDGGNVQFATAVIASQVELRLWVPAGDPYTSVISTIGDVSPVVVTFGE